MKKKEHSFTTSSASNVPKVVLISGASSGMGRATAKILADKGFIVYAGSRDSAKLESLKSENFFPLHLDITDPQSIQQSVAMILKRHNKIDVLVNNAGYGLVSTVEDVSEEEMFDQFNINVFALLRVTKEVIPVMRANRSGVIINISSFLGKIGLPLFTMYNASKYAVEGITDSLRYELKDFNIRVHSVMPGFFDTNFAKDNLVTNPKTFSPDSAYAAMVSTLAPVIVEQINKGNEPKEVGEMILKIIENEHYPARNTIGDRAEKFIPMRKELSDEDFERRVREYYSL